MRKFFARGALSLQRTRSRRITRNGIGGVARKLQAQINLNGPGGELIFTTPRGRLWRERTFYRDVWTPTQEAAGLDIRPHECRHSYVTQLRAAGINDADLAEIAGHRVETMLATYTHPVGGSFSAIRISLG